MAPLGFRLEPEEVRDSDSSQNADNRDNDHELDQSKTFLIFHSLFSFTDLLIGWNSNGPHLKIPFYYD
jgi:hypothetical protein